MFQIDSSVGKTLTSLAVVLASARDPWWIIGSAAVALHLYESRGGDPGTIADVDVIVSRRDLDDLFTRLALTNTPEAGKVMFASDRFGRWSEPPLDVEFMAALKLRVGDEWQEVEPQTRQRISLGERSLFVLDKAELIAILQSFGREKDLRRAGTLI